MTRACTVAINLAALNHNLACVRHIVGKKTRILAMIKANAYGHGLCAVANNMPLVDGLGVATLDEALILRRAGLSHPIVLMSGFYSMDELQCVARHQIAVVVHTPEQVAMLNKAPLKHTLDVWLKLDTGMHRLGFTPHEFNKAYVELLSCEKVRKPLVLMTHLAAADHLDPSFTEQQLEFFNAHTEGLSGLHSICNSAAMLAFKEQHADWVRPGIMLYGVSPFADKTGLDYGLQPVMSLRSKIIAIKDIEPGGRIGYGMNWQCVDKTRVAVVSAGYGDGYPRHAKNGTPVLIDQQLCPVIGRVSMDMLTVDVTQVENIALNSDVVLWGEGLPVEIVASHCGTISYELLSKITSRVEYNYINSDTSMLSES